MRKKREKTQTKDANERCERKTRTKDANEIRDQNAKETRERNKRRLDARRDLLDTCGREQKELAEAEREDAGTDQHTRRVGISSKCL